MELGKLCRINATVDETMLASSVGSGNVGVLATTAMVALMEQAAVQCMSDLIGEEETTVSTQLEVSHIGAVPCGEEIAATAEVIKQQGRRVLFKVFCEDKDGIIGTGTHMRLVVNRDRFQQRAEAKHQRA